MHEFYAKRGSQELSEEELTAHIAMAVRLENVGVLLGCGASKGAGGMTMEEIWDWCRKKYSESVTWMTEQKFLYNEDLHEDIIVDVEDLLDRLDIAEAYLSRHGVNGGVEVKQVAA